MSQCVLTEPDSYQSSDSVRHARSLKHTQSVTFKEPLLLELGGGLPEVTVVYETYGHLSPRRDNAVLVCHALSGDSHVARHDESDDPGWWDILVGPGKAIDTDRYFVVCPNILGGCRGTTGPNSINPLTGKRYGTDFPIITVGDMVRAQKWLTDELDIDHLRAVVGGSLGGHMVLKWATRFPNSLAGAVALATSARLTSQAVAFDVVGRNAIVRDPAYQAGKYYESGGRPAVGLAIARMLGHITYLSREAMMQKFDEHRLNAREISTQFETKFSVGSYLAHQGDRFVERFDANSYLTLTMALDLFDLGTTRQELVETLSLSNCRWLLASFSSDWLFPPFQSRELVEALIDAGKPVSYCNIQSDCGHDAFLLPNDLNTYGKMIDAFLDNLGGQDKRYFFDASHEPAGDAATQSPTSIFHRKRIDYDSIVELIYPGASVLDLGCGSGGLLARLSRRGHRQIMGIELDEQRLLACVGRGLDVIHSDVNQGLAAFADRQFDYVVLSQTLQAVIDVERLLDEMLRVGRRAIVSFPNFAFHEYRQRLADEGRAPLLDQSDGFSWYDTPNVRFLSIADFVEFCHRRQIRIHEQISLDTQTGRKVEDNPNLNANVAIFVLSRAEYRS